MAFPDSAVEVTVRAAFGADLTKSPSTWVFTDLTTRLVQTPITISRGVLVGQGSHRSASATVTLTNTDGALTPMLATSPWYPYVDLGTPADVKVRPDSTPWLSDTFTRTRASGWGTPDSGPGYASDAGFSVNGSAGIISIGTANTIARTRVIRPQRDAWVMWDCSIAAVSTGASNVIGCYLRGNGADSSYVWAGFEFGTGGVTRWTIRTVVAGDLNTIEAQVTEAVTYSAGTVVRCEVELIGDTLRARAWPAAGSAPSVWTVTTQLSQLADVKDDYVGMQMWVVNGNTNTLPNPVSVDNLTFSQPRWPRIEGYITDIRPSFQQLPDGTTYSVVQVDIGGVGTRLERQDDTALSPLRRSLEKASVPPVVYWPCEDAAGALQVASAFPDGQPMIVNGPAVFSFDTGVTDDAALHSYGTQNLCSVAAGASLLGLISPAVGATAWTVSAAIAQWTPGVGGGVTDVRMMEWATPGGTFTRWALAQTMTAFEVRAYNDAAGTVTVAASWTGTSGYLNGYDVACSQSGGNINVTLYLNAAPIGTGTLTGTLAAVSRVTINPDKVNTTASVNPFGIKFIAGHIQVHDQALATALPYYYDGSTLLRADRGWGYEVAHRRFGRLCDEERVPYKVTGRPYITGLTPLNVQQPGTFSELLTAATDAESGAIVFEDGFGYTMLPRGERYNAGVALTVDMSVYRYSSGSPTDVLVPKLDARGPNYWTVRRTGGSQAVAAAGAAYRRRRGTLRDSATLDVLYDDDCTQHANWRVHLYTDGQQANYPNLALDLAANPGLLEDYLSLMLGDRVQRTNQPTIAGLGVIDQVVDQMTETITPRLAGGPAWTATLDCSPATVWQIGVFDSQRLDSSSTTLGADVTGTDTVFSFSTKLAGDVWATDEPLMQVVVDGQTTTVQWMSGVGSVTTLEGGFETGVTGWLTANSTVVQSSAFAHTGSKSAQLSVTGSPASASLSHATLLPIAANTNYTVSYWIYSAVSLANVEAFVSWYTAGNTFITSNVTVTPVTIPAATWTQMTLTALSPGTAGLCRAGVLLASSPPAGTVVYIDDLDLYQTSAATGSGPYVQKAWVTRDPVVTGGIKAGTEIHTSDPLWWGL